MCNQTFGSNDDFFQTRRIGVEEGWRALYKGLGPSLVGIIPARYVTSFESTLSFAAKELTRPAVNVFRAINFYFYPTSKVYLAKQFPNAPTEKPGQTAEDSPVIHLGAAIVAGIMTSTGTNPIWGECFFGMMILPKKKKKSAVQLKRLGN